jgi:cytoskeletal protein CcmA (bactofilin family)
MQTLSETEDVPKNSTALLALWGLGVSVLVAVTPPPVPDVTAAYLPPAKTSVVAVPTGWTRVEVQGTLTSVNARSATFVLSVASREKPTVRTVKLPGGSVVQMKSSIVYDVGELRVGDQVKVWGYTQPEGSLLSAHVLLLSRRGNSALSVPAAAPFARSGLYGLVLAVSDEGFTIVTDAGQVKEVLRAPIARIQGSAGETELKALDIVQVDGNVLSDGNFSATRITVEFAAGTARRMNGRVTAVVPEVSLFVLDDAVYVNVLPTTFIVQGTALRSVRDLVVGRSVQVVGAVGTTPFVVKGRIVVLHI